MMIDCACKDGWIALKPGRPIAEKCPVCRGFGVLSENRMSMLLGVSKSSVKLLLYGHGRPRRSTCERILAGALDLETKTRSGGILKSGSQVTIL